MFLLKSVVLSTRLKEKPAKTAYCHTIDTSAKQPRSVKISKNVGEYACFAELTFDRPPGVSVFIRSCSAVADGPRGPLWGGVRGGVLYTLTRPKGT